MFLLNSRLVLWWCPGKLSRLRHHEFPKFPLLLVPPGTSAILCQGQSLLLLVIWTCIMGKDPLQQQQ